MQLCIDGASALLPLPLPHEEEEDAATILHSIIEFQLLSTIRFDIAGESKTRATTKLPRKNRESWQLPWSERATSSLVARC
jgi:hypothetical protein